MATNPYGAAFDLKGIPSIAGLPNDPNATRTNQGGETDARSLDFDSGGSSLGSLDTRLGFAPDSGVSTAESNAKHAGWLQNQGLNPDGSVNDTAYGTPQSQGGTAQGWGVTTPDNPGVHITADGQVHSGGNSMVPMTTVPLDANNQPIVGATGTDSTYQTFGEGVTGEGAGMKQDGGAVLRESTPFTVGSGDPRNGSALAMGQGGAYGDTATRVQGIADTIKQQGDRPPVGGMGGQEQMDALDRAMAYSPSAQQAAAQKTADFNPSAQQAATGQVNAYQSGPRAQTGVMNQLDQFAQQPAGPSAAELQLQQGAQGNMADALSLARSGRSRDAGSQARNLNVAQANNAATNVDTTRDTALLRANEAATRSAQNLQALGQKGQLAQGVDTGTLSALGIGSDLAKGTDQSTLAALGIGADLAKGTDTSTLSALGLGGDIANAMRGANVTERGQGLDFTQGMNSISAGLEGDVLKNIPQMEQIRHSDEFDLTPEQKIQIAKMGVPKEPSTFDKILGTVGDVASAL